MEDERANELAGRIQDAIPLRERPFRAVAADLGTDEEAVLEQLHRWKENGKLREISAILEGEVFGNDSALVCCAVGDGRIREVAEIINQHPTVTHNYRRPHDYDLWFTISIPPHMEMQTTLDLLGEETGVDEFHVLRRTETYKIGVNFDLDDKESSTERSELESPEPMRPTDRQKRMFRAIQTPMEIVERPFDRLAARADVSAGELLEFTHEMLERGAVRRYVATFHHRELGVQGNGMAVWNVPDDRQTEVGYHLAGASEVSHCYARNTAPGFPYNVYSMIHGPDEESVRGVAARLSDEVDVDDYEILFSTHEFKKCRLRYFQPELEEWWNRRTRPEARRAR